MPYGSPHLNSRSLSTECEACAHGQHAAKEFHGDQNQRRCRLLLMQHRLDIRDAASLCSWREFSDQAGSQSSRHGGNANYEREPANLLSVCPIDERVPKAIRPLEGQSKDSTYEAGYAPTARAKSASIGSPPSIRKGFEPRATFFTNDVLLRCSDP